MILLAVILLLATTGTPGTATVEVYALGSATASLEQA